MAFKIFQVDAFASGPFTGNPACVCLMDQDRSDDWFQNVAAEMNLSETAFVWRSEDQFRLRWFTPKTEVALCGHATLATAHTLWESGMLPADQQAIFETLSGRLSASKIGDQIFLDFPANPAAETMAPEGLIEALGVEPLYIGSDKTDFLVVVDGEDVVRSTDPDHRQLREIDARGIMVTSHSEGEFDFVSRFFAPGAGIDEDPVTGSAHCVLTPYWAQRLGKTELRAYQASARGGELALELVGDRVKLGGRAHTIFCGDLEV